VCDDWYRNPVIEGQLCSCAIVKLHSVGNRALGTGYSVLCLIKGGVRINCLAEADGIEWIVPLSAA